MAEEGLKAWANDSYMRSMSDWRAKFFHSLDSRILLMIRKRVLYILDKEDKKCP